MTAQLIKIPRKKGPPKQNIGVIVQARMTSKRFPGKSMMLLDGKPVIKHVLQRCKHIRDHKGNRIKVILAVPDTAESEPMLQLAASMKGVDNFCGDEDNVLKRYYEAAKFFNLEVIVRITGDCPFISPTICSEALQLLLFRKLDYVSNSYPNRTFPKGMDVEVFTFDCLEAAYKFADTDYQKEHVTPWMQNEPEVKKASIEQAYDHSSQNWCVDYPEDLNRLEEIIKEMKSQASIHRTNVRSRKDVN